MALGLRGHDVRSLVGAHLGAPHIRKWLRRTATQLSQSLVFARAHADLLDRYGCIRGPRLGRVGGICLPASKTQEDLHEAARSTRGPVHRVFFGPSNRS